MKFALRELLYGKKKYILIELLLVLLMFMVLFLCGLVEGLGRAVTSAIDNRVADYYILSDSAEKLITVSELPDGIINEVREKTNSEVTTLDIQRMYLQKQGEERKLNVIYFAIDANSFLAPSVIEGKTLEYSDKDNPIVLDDDFMAEDIHVGDIIIDSASGFEFNVVGFAKDEMYGHVSVGFITRDSYTQIRTRLNPQYGTTIHALAFKGKPDDLDMDGKELVKKQDIIDNIPSYRAEHLTITMIIYVLVIVSAIVIGVFYYIMTIQKRRQFGVMKAVGFGMGKLSAIVVSEVSLLSVFAAVVANIFTFAMSAVIPQKMPFHLLPADAVSVSAGFVLISIVSSLISIIHISRVDPIQAIGGNDE